MNLNIALMTLKNLRRIFLIGAYLFVVIMLNFGYIIVMLSKCLIFDSNL